jgi:heptaprenyl diphosphate synthase
VTLRVLASTNPKDRELQELLSAPIESEAVVMQVLAELRVHPALEQSRTQLLAIAKEARNALGPLPICDATSALFSLCDAVIERTN